MLLFSAVLYGGGGYPLSAVEFVPGQEVALSFKRVVKPLIVYLPENYDAAKRWPVVFHYHGTGGNPRVAIPRAYTNGKDFILVGMEYATLRSRVAEEDYLDVEISHRYSGVNADYEDEHFGRRAGMEILRLRNMIYASSLWRWPSEEAKQKVMAKLKADPPPTIDRDPLVKEFQRLHRMLDGQ